MQHDEFIGLVQHYARLSSRGEAERATRVTLEVLAERLAGGEVKDLASQLPREIGHHLQGGFAGMGERFPLEDFFRRVSLRENVDVAKARYHAQAVMTVVSKAVSKGELDDVRAQLPDEYEQLFEEISTE